MTRYLTPPQLARQLAIDAAKVIGWIRAGELRAINIATTLAGRPRYRIDPRDADAFLARRAAAATSPPPAARSRRRRPDSDFIEYF
jgi:hypothetical protein